MLLNKILLKLRRPEKGYDPISKQYALEYYKGRNNSNISDIVDDIEKKTGSVKGLDVLDLGAGPGLLSIEMAKRKSNVFWHDISNNYLQIARKMAHDEGVNLNFDLGYLEEAKGKYDLIIISICWFYCIDDKFFYEKIKRLMKKNGKLYIIFNNEQFFFKKLKDFSFFKKIILLIQFYLNNYFNIKIGHARMSDKKIFTLFNDGYFKYLNLELKDRNIVLFAKK